MAASEPQLRLSKYLSQKNICSRREAELFIERGWLEVDGVVVREQGARVSESSEVVLSGQAKEYQRQLITVLLNKPVGFVSGQPEPGYRPAASLVRKQSEYRDRMHPSPQRIRWPLAGLAPAGRLDIDSTGLLVLTQDGRIAKRLVADDSDIEKEYLVRTSTPVRPEHVERLHFGIELDGVKLRRAAVEQIDDRFFRITLREGRKRQIRRMCDLVGLKVTELKRVRIGDVKLGSLPLGKWRKLGYKESF